MRQVALKSLDGSAARDSQFNFALWLTRAHSAAGGGGGASAGGLFGAGGSGAAGAEPERVRRSAGTFMAAAEWRRSGSLAGSYSVKEK